VRVLDRYYIALWSLKLKKPRTSRNQHGPCTLHIDKLRKRYPRLFAHFPTSGDTDEAPCDLGAFDFPIWRSMGLQL
jgi:hypothetical protein